jgi:eukaryotic-like serine/threonine-protein kinase
MGEVYRARDARLDRTVAVKVLHSNATPTPDALARFEREARSISQLSHPHICPLFDVGQEGAIRFLVMLLLDGETLAALLLKAPLSRAATLRYATEMADALDAAHRAGFVHRDLKPANVMVTKSGVKLLDFGLAKTSFAASAGVATVGPITAAGAIAGTFQYMAPEQLEGRGADHRSDIWALGAVIYEMATGERLFRSTPRVISPPALDRIVRTCLADDPEDRWQSARDIVLQLRAVAAAPAVDVAPTRKAWLPWAIAAAAVALATVSGARFTIAPTRTETPPVRFSLGPPSGNAFWDNLETVPVAMAPDGSRFGFIASDGRDQRVWIRSLSEIDATPLAGTEGARSLFWSPDGHSVGFFANGKLKRIDLPNGSPVVLCDVPNGTGIDGAWGAGDIVYA